MDSSTAPLARPGWWQTASAITRASLKANGRSLQSLISDLDRVWAEGFDAIELFAPCAGGSAYDGLDTVDFYAVDPAIGSMADLRQLVAECHRRGMALVLFLNLGYCNESLPAFLKACDDVSAGRQTRETAWFVWSRDGSDRMERPLAPYFLNDADGRWHWSERAGSHYWVKWEGESGGHHFPQFNFADPGWQAEIRRIVHFWAELGIDGLVADAVNWYIGCDWDIVRSTITNPLSERGNLFSHPEGAGGFGDDPVPWVVEGGFNCLMDYSLALWWEGIDVISEAIVQADARLVDRALTSFRDRVDDAGGICCASAAPPSEVEAATSLPARAQLLRAVTVASVGELVLDLQQGKPTLPDEESRQLSQVLLARRRYPALCATGQRITLATAHDRRCLAFVRRPVAGGQPVLVALNFSSQPIDIELDLTGQGAGQLVDVLAEQAHLDGPEVRLSLPSYGFTLRAFS